MLKLIVPIFGYATELPNLIVNFDARSKVEERSLLEAVTKQRDQERWSVYYSDL